MKIWKHLFVKKTRIETGAEKNIMVAVKDIMEKSEDVLNRIFEDHKLDLLVRDPSYIIYSVFGRNDNSTLTENQLLIHKQLDPIVHHMADILGSEHLTDGQRAAMLLVIRMMMLHKILFIMELFKNSINQKLADDKNTQNMMGKISIWGHA